MKQTKFNDAISSLINDLEVLIDNITDSSEEKTNPLDISIDAYNKSGIVVLWRQ